MSSAALVAEILADSPEIYWPFNEPSGTLADISGHGGRDATINGTITRSVSMGPIGDGITLAGGAGYITGPNTAGYIVASNGATAFTFALWGIIPATPGSQSTLFIDNGLAYNWIEPSGVLDGYDFRTGSDGFRGASPAISFDTLHQIIIVCDIAVGVTYYVDGVAVGTVAPGGSGASWTDVNTGLGLYLGHDPASTRPLIATVGHVAFYSYALSAGRVAAQYAAGIDGTVSGDPNQDAWLQIDENVGLLIGEPLQEAMLQIDENIGISLDQTQKGSLQVDEYIVPVLALGSSVPASMSLTSTGTLSVIRSTKLTIVDDRSTAPHGFFFEIKVLEDIASLTLSDPNDGSWMFKVIPSGGFLKDDHLYGCSDINNKYLYLKRGEDIYTIVKAITLDSNWPLLFPGENKFEWTPTYIEWIQVWYYPTYWGV